MEIYLRENNETYFEYSMHLSTKSFSTKVYLSMILVNLDKDKFLSSLRSLMPYQLIWAK